MTKWFCGSGFAAAMAVTPCSGSVNTVIAGTGIVVLSAAPLLDSSSIGAPTAGINAVSKVDRIIATGNRSTVGAAAKRA
jgi:hypothetical protein